MCDFKLIKPWINFLRIWG